MLYCMLKSMEKLEHKINVNATNRKQQRECNGYVEKQQVAPVKRNPEKARIGALVAAIKVNVVNGG